MKTKQTPTLSWQEAPDIISPEDLSKILGCGIATARNKFDETNFPIIKGLGKLKKADKEAVRLYIQGKEYMEYRSKTISNRIQKEILETLKEIKDLVQNSNESSIDLNDNLNNKSFSLKCYISNEKKNKLKYSH